MTTTLTIDLADLSDDELERLVATGIGDSILFEGQRVAWAARDEIDLRVAAALLGVRQSSWPSLATVRATFGRRDRLLLTELASVFRICWSGAAPSDDGGEGPDALLVDRLPEPGLAAAGDGAADVLEGADQMGCSADADRPDDLDRGGIAAFSGAEPVDGHRQGIGDGGRLAAEVAARGEAGLEEGFQHDASG